MPSIKPNQRFGRRLMILLRVGLPPVVWVVLAWFLWESAQAVADSLLVQVGAFFGLFMALVVLCNWASQVEWVRRLLRILLLPWPPKARTEVYVDDPDARKQAKRLCKKQAERWQRAGLFVQRGTDNEGNPILVTPFIRSIRQDLRGFELEISLPDGVTRSMLEGKLDVLAQVFDVPEVRLEPSNDARFATLMLLTRDPLASTNMAGWDL